MLIKRRPGVLHEMAATWQQCDRRQAQWIYTPLLRSLWTPHTPSQQLPHPHNQSHLVPKPFGCSYFLSSCQATANATASCNRAKLSVDSSQQKSWHPQQQELQNQWQQSESAQSPLLLCRLLLVSKQTVVAAGSRGVPTDPRRATSKTIPRQTC